MYRAQQNESKKFRNEKFFSEEKIYTKLDNKLGRIEFFSRILKLYLKIEDKKKQKNLEWIFHYWIF